MLHFCIDFKLWFILPKFTYDFYTLLEPPAPQFTYAVAYLWNDINTPIYWLEILDITSVSFILSPVGLGDLVPKWKLVLESCFCTIPCFPTYLF